MPLDVILNSFENTLENRQNRGSYVRLDVILISFENTLENLVLEGPKESSFMRLNLDLCTYENTLENPKKGIILTTRFFLGKQNFKIRHVGPLLGNSLVYFQNCRV